MPNHIDFVGQSRQEKLSYSKNVTAQLQLCQLRSKGLKAERVERLWEALFAQEEYLTICNTVKRYEAAQQIVLVEWCIPCIMHLHNRVVEKIIAMLV